MNHSFNVEIAKQLGIEKAIIIQHLQFWIFKNIADGRYNYDGRTWTYCSTKSLAKIFPYLTPRKIEYYMTQLVEEGVLMKGNYNDSTYDRTSWYAFHDFVKWTSRIREMDSTISWNDIKDVREDNNKDLTINNPQAVGQESLFEPVVKSVEEPEIWPTFELFWDTYDKKVDRDKVEAKWKKLKQEDREAIMIYLDDYIPATESDKTFRRNPLTFINRKTWLNEIPIKKNDAERITKIASEERLRSYSD